MFSAFARRVASQSAKARMTSISTTTTTTTTTTPIDETTMTSTRRLFAASFERRCASTRSTTATTRSKFASPLPPRAFLLHRQRPHQREHDRYLRNNARMMYSTSSTINNSPVGWKSLLLLVLTGSGVLFFFENEKKRRMKIIAENQKGVGKAAVGGPFELINAATNKKFTDKDLLGNYCLIYFGFTTCPDICPDELEKMSEVVDIVEKEVEKQKSNTTAHESSPLVPVFISIDPERDTTKVVKEYVKEFHPKLIGLTGSKEQCAKAARAYRVYYHKTNESSKDYLVDHSIIMYLIDKKGDFVAFYGKNYEARPMAMSIVEHMSSLSSNH